MPAKFKIVKGIGRALLTTVLIAPSYALSLIKSTNYFTLFFSRVMSYGGITFVMFAFADEVCFRLHLFDRKAPAKPEPESSIQVQMTENQAEVTEH